MLLDDPTEITRSGRKLRGRFVDAICWVSFFAWTGVVIFVRTLPDGVGSLGVGAIVLFGTLARLLLGASISAFWVLIAAIFLLAGTGVLLGIDFPFQAVALIITGILLLLHSKSKKS